MNNQRKNATKFVPILSTGQLTIRFHSLASYRLKSQRTKLSYLGIAFFPYSSLNRANTHTKTHTTRLALETRSTRLTAIGRTKQRNIFDYYVES